MNPKIAFLFAVAAFLVVAEVSGRSLIEVEPKGEHKGIKSGEYDGCACNKRIVKSKDVKRYPLKLPLECHRPGDTCRCRKVKVTPAHVPRPKYFKQIEKESCGRYIKAPKYMHDFSEVEDFSAEEEYSKMPVDIVSMNIAQELQRKIETKQTEEALAFGFKTIPADRPSHKYRKNVPEADLFAYEKTIVELQPYNVNHNCDSDEDTFQHEVKQPVNTLSYQDVGFYPVSGKSSPKFVKKTCVVDDRSHEDFEVVKKIVGKKVHPKKHIIVEEDISEEIYRPRKVYEKSSEEASEEDSVKMPVESYESKEIIEKIPVYEESREHRRRSSEEKIYEHSKKPSYDESIDAYYDAIPPYDDEERPQDDYAGYACELINPENKQSVKS